MNLPPDLPAPLYADDSTSKEQQLPRKGMVFAPSMDRYFPQEEESLGGDLRRDSDHLDGDDERSSVFSWNAHDDSNNNNNLRDGSESALSWGTRDPDSASDIVPNGMEDNRFERDSSPLSWGTERGQDPLDSPLEGPLEQPSFDMEDLARALDEEQDLQFDSPILDKIYRSLLSSASSQRDEPATRQDFLLNSMLLFETIKQTKSSNHPLKAARRPNNYDVKHSPTETLNLKRDIRQFLKHLLQREHSQDETPQPIPIASPETLRLYKAYPSAINGPDLGRIQFDLVGEMVKGSPWNKRLARLLAIKFIDEEMPEIENLDLVTERFLTHFQTLRTCYFRECQQQSVQDQITTAEQKHAKSEENRRRGRRERRNEVVVQLGGATQFKDKMRIFRSLYKKMSWRAMSGDESETNTPTPCLSITRLPWRNDGNQQVREFFRIPDCLYLATRWTSSGTWTKGGFPELRIPGSRVEVNAQPVPGLPLVFYDPHWLSDIERRDPMAYVALKVDRVTQIDLSWPEEIQRQAYRFSKVYGRVSQALDFLPRTWEFGPHIPTAEEWVAIVQSKHRRRS